MTEPPPQHPPPPPLKACRAFGVLAWQEAYKKRLFEGYSPAAALVFTALNAWTLQRKPPL